MSTRHADDDSELRQERFMSSREYADARGISGIAVTAKAATLENPDERSLLFFLQAISLQPGGLEKFCREFLEMFPERLGTPTMHKLGMKCGQKYSAKEAAQIEREMCRLTGDPDEDNARELDHSIINDDSRPETCLGDRYHSRCMEKTGRLPDFIMRLCVDPNVSLDGPGVGWFKDIIGALYEFKERHAQKALAEYVMTGAGRQVFDTLDACLKTRKMVLIEGDSGIGKTTAAEAWCRAHPGEARFVSLSGVTHKTSVFRAIAKALGVASSYTRTATEMQARNEDVLEKSGLILVLDEAHFLFSAAERVYTRPERVDWINTALYNRGVPVAMICTPQFIIRLNRFEQQTSWNADQLRRRVKRFTRLPAKPNAKDLEAVALKHLPDACKDTIKYLVGYALSNKLHFPAIVDAIDEARLLVEREGREKITFDDVERAIRDYCAQSTEAWQRQFTPPAGARRARRARPAPALPQGEFRDTLSPAEPPINGPVIPGRKTNLTGLAPARTSTLARRSAPLAPDPDGELVEK